MNHRTIEISPDTLLSLLGNTNNASSEHPYRIGVSYLIRTVTYAALGRLVRVTEHELTLEDASWVADTGRFTNALRDGTLSEVEPVFHPMIVGRGALVDANVWEHALPREQK